MKETLYKYYQLKKQLTIDVLENSERFDVELLWKDKKLSSIFYVKKGQNAWFKIDTMFDRDRVLTTPAVIQELNQYLDESLWQYMGLLATKVYEVKPSNQMRGCQTRPPSKKQLPNICVDVAKMF